MRQGVAARRPSIDGVLDEGVAVGGIAHAPGDAT